MNEANIDPNIDRLVKMANQIALNMAANGTEEEVAEQIAQHLGKFWPPSMKNSVSEHLAAVQDKLRRSLTRHLQSYVITNFCAIPQ